MKTIEYGQITDENEARQKALGIQSAMPTAAVIIAQDKLNPAKRLHLELRAVQAARDIWEHTINPFIVTNDLSHPNNWDMRQLLRMAGIIQNALGLPMYEKDLDAECEVHKNAMEDAFGWHGQG